MSTFKEYKEKATTKLLNETGSFFAFGTSQFDEKKAEGVKYVATDYGLVIPIGKVDEVIKGLGEITKLAITLDVQENGADKIIQREYFNHECQIGMDDSDARRAIKSYIKHFPSLFSEKQLKKSFKAAWDKAVEKDLF